MTYSWWRDGHRGSLWRVVKVFCFATFIQTRSHSNERCVNLSYNFIPDSYIIHGSIVVVVSFSRSRRWFAHETFPDWFSQHKLTAVLDQHAHCVRFASLAENWTASILTLKRPAFIATFKRCSDEDRMGEKVAIEIKHIAVIFHLLFFLFVNE